MDTPKKLRFGLIESHSYSIWYNAMTIDTADYPELKGMNKDQMIAYLSKNFFDMVSTEDPEYTLLDDLQGMEEAKDKIYNEEKELYFEEVEDDEEE